MTDRLSPGRTKTHPASHDPLTGVATYELLVNSARQALARATRQDWVTAVLVIDIDDFSHINEAFGHNVGDQVLIELAARLVKALRVSDEVARPGKTIEASADDVARFGSDRFVIICENIVDADAASSLAARIARLVAEPLALDGGEITLTAGVGVGMAGPNGPSVEERILDAETALYKAKQRGRGQCEVMSEGVTLGRHKRADEKQALRRALEEGEFRLHYQPVVSLESGRITGAEALLRWEDPERGLVPPMEFIPLAEEAGLIVPIGKWVIEMACRQAAHWRHRFPRQPALVVSVNVSGRQFGPELVEVVAAALSATGTEPGQLCLELTESILIGDADAAVATLRDIADLGVKLSIDDFGTGYSSLQYLKRFPLHELKVDRSFVDGLGEDDENTAIVAATVAMAHALGLSVVAEGVETADQLERLRVLGCQEVQGFLISRPKPIAEFEQLLAEEDSPTVRWSRASATRQSKDLYRSNRILVVDDAEEVRQLARMTLTAVGFDVQEAADGATALSAAYDMRPDCVILDVSLPDISGIDVCDALRADPITAGCTIVMLTDRADTANKVDAFSCGADDYFVKPFSPRDLVGRVRAAMRRRIDTERPRDRSKEELAHCGRASDGEGGGSQKPADEKRYQAVAQRDQPGDQRDEEAQKRDAVADQRDQAGDQRDKAAGERDKVGDERDEAGQRRDQAGGQRDLGGEERDQAGNQRDRAADQRDVAAVRFEGWDHDGLAAGVLSPSALARREAASDRRESFRDREAGASERSFAELDRDTAATDRGAGASERSFAEFDRDTAAADRGAGASRRSRAEMLEEALRRAMVEADRANQAKSTFLSTMSHEIRTPLNAVIGMNGLLLGTELDDVQREYAEMARSSGEALLGVINHVLDFSKIESGRIDLDEVDFDLCAVVEEAMDLVASSAYAKGLEVAALVEPDLPFGVRGDPGRLRQVLINLLANAVKFTEEGEVIVKVKLVGEPAGFVDWRIEVSDTGIGIASDQCERLFESFSQADASTTRLYGGTGLGLAISKHLVGLFGGEIGVASELGRGSTFWFTARLSRAEVPIVYPWASASELDGLRVLLVGENSTIRTVLDRNLRSWRMHPTCVGDGPGALAEMRAAADAGRPFAAAILDHHMSGMNGLEVARAIRGDERIRATPLALLTSPRRRGDAEQARQADVQAVLAKPVHRSSLFDGLATMMGSGQRPIVGDMNPYLAACEEPVRAHVLVVEDNVPNQMVAARTLENMGYRVDVAANGLEAVEALARIPYGAVLMDCQMPEMDGYEATREIRRREGPGRRTPIIAMTAAASCGDEARCLEAGMDDHMSKPVQPAKLKELLQRWVGDRGQVPAPREEGSSTVLTPLELEALKDLEKTDPDGVAAMVELFLVETRSRLDTLRATPGDVGFVARTAHTLSGSCINFAATEMASMCREVHDAAAAADFSLTEATLDRLDREYCRVAAALRKSFRL